MQDVRPHQKSASSPSIIPLDPKAVDYSVYRGATVIKPNRKELSDATRQRADSDADVIAAASQLSRLLGTEAVVVSLSDAGLILVPAEGAAVHVPAYTVKLRDTSGAGDTVVAALAVLLATKAGYEPAVRAANAAAAVVVGKRGTATVSAAELRSRILPAALLAPEEPNGATCASGSRMAASICCTLGTLSSYPRPVLRATDSSSVSTATPQCDV
jgi:D-beta-D-heptose 7-phosphate kinase / D-beta-D-heptose 1-phosphate adenosyltransferase